MYLIYNVVLFLSAALGLPWLAYRLWRGRLPGLRQRLGFLPIPERSPKAPPSAPPKGPTVWLHAVSVGEVKSAASLVEQLRGRIPEVQIIVTSSTKTGWDTARHLFPHDTVLFPPLDFPWICRRFLHRLNPSAVMVLETELWPNFFRQVKKFGAALMLVNGRISDRAFPRYQCSRFLWRRVLALPDVIFPQSAQSASRFLALGAPPEKVRAVGNLKFAARPNPASFAEILQRTLRDSKADPVIVAGSTMPGEETLLLDTYLELIPEFPDLWMILAPRHPERFSEVAGLVRSLRIPLTLRSEYGKHGEPYIPGVLLLDSMGELGALYELATVAFVGGTLVPTGGHNILEPAYFGKPIVIGPSMENFQEIADQFLRNATMGKIAEAPSARLGSIIQLNDSTELAASFRFLFNNESTRERMGSEARQLLNSKLGGVAPVLDELERLLALRKLPSRENQVNEVINSELLQEK